MLVDPVASPIRKGLVTEKEAFLDYRRTILGKK
jgi:hypothetical protein